MSHVCANASKHRDITIYTVYVLYINTCIWIVGPFVWIFKCVFIGMCTFWKNWFHHPPNQRSHKNTQRTTTHTHILLHFPLINCNIFKALSSGMMSEDNKREKEREKKKHSHLVHPYLRTTFPFFHYIFFIFNLFFSDFQVVVFPYFLFLFWFIVDFFGQWSD